MVARRAPAQRSLKEYRRKRDFSRSPEPSGAERALQRDKRQTKKKTKKQKSLFFCVQKHLASQLHYDFRLEHAGVLLSWAVPKGPSLNPSDKRLAMKVEDHPFDYGAFEGVIPEGYGAGIVMLWDRGTWSPLTDDIDAALNKGELKFELDGVKLKGSWVLVRTRGRDSRSWLLIKHRDDWVTTADITTVAPLSVKSFGDFEDILAAEKPEIWLSNRPARSGASGAMFDKIIRMALKLKDRDKSKRRSDGATKRQRAKSTATKTRSKS